MLDNNKARHRSPNYPLFSLRIALEKAKLFYDAQKRNAVDIGVAIKTIGYETKFYNAFAALSIGYFVNFVVPRLGEVTRCLSLKKQHSIPFMQSLGTVIIERIIDIVSLMIVLFSTPN